jgi:hypothetical protein
MNRLRMLRSLIGYEDSTQSFNDSLIGLDMNPKTIREHSTRPEKEDHAESPKREIPSFQMRRGSLHANAGCETDNEYSGCVET